MYFTTQAPEP